MVNCFACYVGLAWGSAAGSVAIGGSSRATIWSGLLFHGRTNEHRRWWCFLAAIAHQLAGFWVAQQLTHSIRCWRCWRCLRCCSGFGIFRVLRLRTALVQRRDLFGARINRDFAWLCTGYLLWPWGVWGRGFSKWACSGKFTRFKLWSFWKSLFLIGCCWSHSYYWIKLRRFWFLLRAVL